MEKLKDSGLAKSGIYHAFFYSALTVTNVVAPRSIGVSNFGVEHLEQVFSVAKHIPVVNQVTFQK